MFIPIRIIISIFLICQSMLLVIHGDPQYQLGLVNAARSQYGLSPLEIVPCMMDYAQAHSDYQSAINSMTHNDPRGDLFQRGRVYGAILQSAAENVAYGADDDDTVMEMWLQSPGHRANILGRSSTIIGFGVSLDGSGRKYWTQYFGNGQCSTDNNKYQKTVK
ncbi:hypothetical protein DFA_04346 [Cavenderia fasciculata]|uniref:SCP domain-containing protein n=1 Tax=Cavenderia fasciculata TaxID=261658 RepID=F4PPB5_CACFS|nr:uncharacterized protein DFA_04346 [Cavenderia fasciculata]EGG22228.1 hypothetical protein DFA_04346 [Cavenderia fasciculata]|eukprot:XP_004360079.1 hypothetical protein DFA_04346 [Cavenderia fasciculata]